MERQKKREKKKKKKAALHFLTTQTRIIEE